jgi:4-amino-4-deoxy-L-arabinose transferase-like glycosyltransferase
MATLSAAAGRIGPLYSADSQNYVVLSERMFTGVGWRPPFDWIFEPQLVQGRGPWASLPPWPPGYSAATEGLARLSGLDAARAAWFLSLATCLLTVPLVFLLARRAELPPLAAGLAALAFAVTAPALRCASYAWSEPPFLFLIVLALLWMSTSRSSLSLAALVGLAVAAATLTRYLGAAMIPVAAGWAILAFRRQGQGRALAATALSAGVPVLALAAWLVRNYAVSGHAQTSYGPPDLSFLQNLAMAVHGLGSCLFGFGDSDPGMAVALVLLAVAVGAAWRAVRRVDGDAEVMADGRRTLALLASWAATFVVLTCALRSRSYFAHIDTRILFPAWPAVLILLLSLLARACRATAGWARVMVAVPVAGLALVVAVGQVRSYAELVSFESRDKTALARTVSAAHDPALLRLFAGRRVLCLEDDTLSSFFASAIAAHAASVCLTTRSRLYRGFTWQAPELRAFLTQIDYVTTVDIAGTGGREERRDFQPSGPPILRLDGLAIYTSAAAAPP